MAYEKGSGCSFFDLSSTFLKPYDNLELTLIFSKPYINLERFFTKPYDNLERHFLNLFILFDHPYNQWIDKYTHCFFDDPYYRYNHIIHP